ncbi:MAG: methylmalonyl-CoA mutase family protein, partial [Candidatus Competibacter denitrificans]
MSAVVAHFKSPQPGVDKVTPRHKIRFVTATSLFDGHDASINIMRRIIQGSGAEVIHLGHNRSVEEIVTAALQEDVQGIAVSSYQGGHVEFFKYMMDLLRERGGDNIKVFGGGGGVIVPEEIRELHDYGVTRLFSPEDGQAMGLQGMIDHMIAVCDVDPGQYAPKTLDEIKTGDWRALSRLITALENRTVATELRQKILSEAKERTVPILGITGTGGSGKSSLTDELVRRFRLDQDDRLKIAVIAADPSRRKTGGALLGDRIRMNALSGPNLYMRSLATRAAGSEVPETLGEILAACKLAGFDLIIVETSGIGQGDAAIVPLVDRSLYVMTPEFGAASQLEKIDMLDFADAVAINKFDRKGAEDALRDVRKQVQRNRKAFGQSPDEMPVYGTIAARFNDNGVTALYQGVTALLRDKGLKLESGHLPPADGKASTSQTVIVPAARARYLAEIADTVRGYHKEVEKQVKLIRQRQQLRSVMGLLTAEGKSTADLQPLLDKVELEVDSHARKLVDMWPQVKESYSGEDYVVKIRDKEIRYKLTSQSLSGSRIPKVSLPRFDEDGELLRWMMLENLPGSFPYTAGVFAFKRENEDPTRMFAGEGDPFRTNRRFKKLSEHAEATRLSTAFDSVTLYGFDPNERPDIYGKVGNSGVSIATLDDLKVLYSGFEV